MSTPTTSIHTATLGEPIRYTNPSTTPNTEAQEAPMNAPTNSTTDTRTRILAIIDEMNSTIMNRKEVIWGCWVARVAQLHLLMVGPGGTGKSMLSREMTRHITGATHFETALDETTDPAQVFGPPDIKAMVEDGKMRRVTTSMLPEATDAFIDEFFNGNGPVLHSLMPALNERVFHNNGMPSDIPLRQALMGTNKLNADADQAALWDRVHLRYTVGYLSSKKDMLNMAGAAIVRLARAGRGTTTSVAANPTTVTLEELDAAQTAALELPMPDEVADALYDLRIELQSQGIVISDRRFNDGVVAVLANAWLRGHAEVRVADLDILTAMWWTLQEQQKQAKETILALTNPGEKVALGLLDELDKMYASIKTAKDEGRDASAMVRIGIESMKNGQKLLADANEQKRISEQAGTNTDRLEEVVTKTEEFLKYAGIECLGVEPAKLAGAKL